MKAEDVCTLLQSGSRAFRDALHFAVLPVRAGETLRRGQRINIVRSVAFAAADGEPADAVVPPFLNVAEVTEGQRFYAMLWPGTVTEVRHTFVLPGGMV